MGKKTADNIHKGFLPERAKQPVRICQGLRPQNSEIRSKEAPQEHCYWPLVQFQVLLGQVSGLSDSVGAIVLS